MKLALAAAPLLLAGACVPHSAAVGQTAAPLATGGAEVAMSLGVAQSRMTTYQDDANPGDGDDDTTVQTQLPAFEGNFLYGLTDTIGLNIHGSNAGLQPGLKISLVDGPDLHVALLPAFAVGLSSFSDPDAETAADSFDSMTFLGGARVLLSTLSGAYGAIGYEFQRTTFDDPDTGEAAGHYDFHRMTGAVGYDIAIGKGFHVRPEMSVLYGLAGTSVDDTPEPMSDASQDVDSLVLFPSVTFAVQTN